MSKPISADFPFESKYIEVLGSKMHYIDEGDGPVMLFLHGNPTSSYLWRNIIPYLTPHARCIAPDLIGMGHSDKPDLDYGFFDHARYLDAFIEALDLEDITLVLHDWGSGLGFHYFARHEDNVRAIAFMEAIMQPARWSGFPKGWKLGFKLMRSPAGYLIISVMNGFVKQVLPKAIVRSLTPEEKRRYAEPYPTIKSRKPLRRWPQEIPIDGTPSDVHDAVSAYSEALQASPVPKILFHALPGGLIDAKGRAWCEEHLPKLEVVEIAKGLHFVQEDDPHGIGEGLAAWFVRLSA